jgi:hypothetical protein
VCCGSCLAKSKKRKAQSAKRKAQSSSLCVTAGAFQREHFVSMCGPATPNHVSRAPRVGRERVTRQKAQGSAARTSHSACFSSATCSMLLALRGFYFVAPSATVKAANMAVKGIAKSCAFGSLRASRSGAPLPLR